MSRKLLSLLFAAAFSVCAASSEESRYMITESQLEELETELETQRERLRELETQSEGLRIQSENLRNLSESLGHQLAESRRSLKKSEARNFRTGAVCVTVGISLGIGAGILIASMAGR